MKLTFLMSAGMRVVPQGDGDREKPKNERVGHWVTKLNPTREKIKTNTYGENYQKHIIHQGSHGNM